MVSLSGINYHKDSQWIHKLVANKTTTDSWNLEGTVSFRGEPCNPDSVSYKVPPCSGPYPDYEITIHPDVQDLDLRGSAQESEKVSTVIRTKTDERGEFKVSLEPGKYVIYTRSGISPSDNRSNTVTITEGKSTHLDLIVDTGVR